MLNQKENYKVKKRLTKVISRLFLQNKGLSPQVLLNATIQTQDGHVRFWKGFFGLLLIVLGIYLFFLSMGWGLLAAIIIIPIGILVLRDAWSGNKKRVRDYLRELADLPDPSGLPDLDLDKLVSRVFSDCGAKFKGGGGEFGGGGASGSWDSSILAEPLPPSDIPVTLDPPDLSNISLDISLGDLPDVSEGAGQIAGSILEGIFSGF